MHLVKNCSQVTSWSALPLDLETLQTPSYIQTVFANIQAALYNNVKILHDMMR